jgi:fumarate hydratase class II
VNYELGLFNEREVDGNPARSIGETQGNERGKRFSAQQLADSVAQAAAEVMDGKWDDQFVVEPFPGGCRDES